MKNSLTQQHLLRHPEKLKRFSKVLIWSGQWRLWWRAGGSGYTMRIEEAGIFMAQEAMDHVKHCGPEKKISLVGVACK